MASLSIVGPGEYEDVVAEIDCSPAFTAIVRNERGKYFIEIFNCEASQIEDFAMGHKMEKNSVDLEEFLSCVEVARERLAYQSNSNSNNT